MFDTLKKCWLLVGADARGRWLLIVVLAIFLGGVESASALLVFVLLGLITGGEGSPIHLPVVGDVRELFPAWEEQSLFLAASGFIVIFFLLRGLLLLSQTYAESRVVQNAAARLATRLLRGYLALPYAYHLGRNSSQLIRNVYQSVRHVVGTALGPLLTLVSQGILAIGMVSILLVVAPRTVLLAVVVLLPLAYILLRIVHPRLKRQGRINQSMEKETLQTLQQSLGGIRDIKVGGRERFFLKEFAERRGRLARVQYVSATLKGIPRVGIETTLVVLIAILLALITAAEGSPDQALPILGLFAYGAFRLKQPLKDVLRVINSLRFAGPAVDDVYEDVMAGMQAIEQRKLENSPAPLPFRHRIELEDVSFRYEGTLEDALKNINLTIERGESIGLVGRTGGGKSTLVNLLLGLLSPTTGTIRVDGLDISGRTRTWQRNLGMVPQSVFLVDDTIRRNIALGLDEDEIDDSRVTRLVRMVQLEDLVSSLPKGLETVVGERGARLSGGQQQRIVIARALYHDPEVLILDEGTSALDNTTEAAVMDTLENLRGAVTLIIVAHRLSTVRHCDRILVIEGGRIVDIGTYSELAGRNGLFHELSRMSIANYPS